MTKVNSKYKLFGGFGLLLWLNALMAFGTYKLFTASNISYDKVDFTNDSDALLAYFVMIGFNVLFLLLFMTQSKYVITDSDGITFINPLLPFLRKKYAWSDFDFYILVDEDSSYSSYEAVWFVKDEKLKGRFSSFYYTNYLDLKRQIKTTDYGKKTYSQLGQFFVLLGIKRIKNLA